MPAADLPDPIALARARRRLAAGQRPWVYAEAARRLAERLAWIKVPVRTALQWSPPGTQAQDGLPHAQWRRVDGTPVRGISRARQWLGGVTTVAPEATAGLGVDLVWSVFGLPWECDPRAHLLAWRAALAPEGFVMFATLGPGSFAPLRALYAERGWGPPHAAITDMHDWGDRLVDAGFEGPVMDQEVLTLTYDSPEALLAEWRACGLNAAQGRAAGLRTPRWRRHLCDALSGLRGADGRIAMPWELVYGHAFRGTDRGPAVTPEARIDLSTMQSLLRRGAVRG